MTQKLKVVFSADAELDFDFLFESYQSFGDGIVSALQQAETKTQSIRKSADKLAAHPFRGMLHDDMLPGLWYITMGRAIYWFDILEDERLVRMLAVFYGGQDHHTKMLTRLLGGK